MMNLAVFYGRMRQTDKALPLALKAIEVQKHVFGADATAMIGNYMNVANILIGTKDRGNIAKAAEHYGHAILIAEQNPTDPNLANLYAARGKLYLRLKRRKECVEEFR